MPDTLLWQAMIWVLIFLRILRDYWVPRVPTNSGHNPPINLSLPNPSIPPHPLGMPHHPHVSASPTHVLCKLCHLHPPPPLHYLAYHPYCPSTFWHLPSSSVHILPSCPSPPPPLKEGGMPKWAVG